VETLDDAARLVTRPAVEVPNCRLVLMENGDGTVVADNARVRVELRGAPVRCSSNAATLDERATSLVITMCSTAAATMQRSVTLTFLSPSAEVLPRNYMFADASSSGMCFVIDATASSSGRECDAFEAMLRTQTIFQRVAHAERLDASEHRGATANTLRAHSTARGIERGGTALGQGLVSTGSLLGRGFRGLSSTLVKRTDQRERRAVTQQERDAMERSRQRSQRFASSAGFVANGLTRGCEAIGGGLARGYHATTESGWYQRNLASSAPPSSEPPSARKEAAVGVLKGTVNAFGSVVSGAAQGGKIAARDARDARVSYVTHREGSQAAQMTRERWNVTGRSCVGTFDCVRVVGTSTLGVGIKVGKGVATHDPNAHTLLGGGTWCDGPLRLQEFAAQPWVTRHCVLRTYALALYDERDSATLDKPLYYIKLGDIKRVEALPDTVLSRANSLSIVTKSATFMLTMTECNYADAAQARYRWINMLLNVVQFNDKNFIE
jgi:Senescence domain